MIKERPAKPYRDFPLTPHNSGKWTKKIRGKLYYFGRWDDPQAALREYNAVKDTLHSGRVPVITSPASITVRQLFNLFLDHQMKKVDAGRIEPATYHDARRHYLEFAKVIGPNRLVAELGPVDFAAARTSYAKHYGPHALTRAISNVKTAFNFAHDEGKSALPPFGAQFTKDSARAHRRAARTKTHAVGAKLFTPRECRDLIAAAPIPLKAMILLGLNSGFYGVDCAGLPIAALNLSEAWLEFARTKTEVMRKAVLWPETITAIRESLKARPTPRNAVDDGLVFLTPHGKRWVHPNIHRDDSGITKVTKTDAVNAEMTKLLESLEMRRKGVNFSALRSTFRTAADSCGDKNAVLLMMGHAFPGMDEFYVREVARKRLKRVADHVRKALLNPKKVRAITRKKPANRRH